MQVLGEAPSCPARDGSPPNPAPETRSTRAHLIGARERRAMQMPCHGCRNPERGLPLLEYFAHSRSGHLFLLAPVIKISSSPKKKSTQSPPFMQVQIILFSLISVTRRTNIFLHSASSFHWQLFKENKNVKVNLCEKCILYSVLEGHVRF